MSENHAQGASIGRERFPALDLLRALAVLLVLLYHGAHYLPEAPSALRLVLETGWNGVYLFFVLSGFLVGRLAEIELAAKGRLSISRFWIRRFLRTWPLYFLLLFLEWWRHGYSGPPSLFHYLTFTQNFFPLHFLVPTWSLAIEEQFYFFLPLLLALLVRLRLQRLLAPLCLLGIALSPVNRFFHQSLATHSLSSMDSLFAGMLLARWHLAGHPLLTTIRRQAALCTAAGFLLAFVAALPLSLPAWGLVHQSLLALGFGLAVAANTGAQPPLAPLLRLPFLGFISAASYSIYLTQGQPLFWVGKLAAAWPLGIWLKVFFVLGLGAAAATAWGGIFYWLVEKPGMRLREVLLRRFKTG
jgi:peptidoglycan/LPS O-acetylase OafA/YrhL